MKTLKKIWIGNNSYDFADQNNNITTVHADSYEEASLKYKLFCDPNLNGYDWE